nr:MAG TPA: hypothetical protein [Caudoviricetes sp.]
MSGCLDCIYWRRASALDFCLRCYSLDNKGVQVIMARMRTKKEPIKITKSKKRAAVLFFVTPWGWDFVTG